MSTTKRSSATDSQVGQKRTRSTPEEVATGVDESGQSLDKVRDILFGANMRTYEERLALLEQRMLDEMAQIQKTADAKFEGLESSVRKELDTFDDRLQSEKGERSADVKSASDALEHRLAQLEGRLTESGDGLSDQIRDQTEALATQLQQMSSQITARIDRELKEIREAKPDTASLAAMFAEFAERLRDQPPHPD